MSIETFDIITTNLNAILAWCLIIALVPITSLLFALYYAGRRLTAPERRTELGNHLARFILHLGIFLTAIVALMLNRWIDFDTSVGPAWIGVLCRAVGLYALAVCIWIAWVSWPLVLTSIRQGALLTRKAALTSRKR